MYAMIATHQLRRHTCAHVFDDSAKRTNDNDEEGRIKTNFHDMNSPTRSPHRTQK